MSILKSSPKHHNLTQSTQPKLAGLPYMVINVFANKYTFWLTTCHSVLWQWHYCSPVLERQCWVAKKTLGQQLKGCLYWSSHSKLWKQFGCKRDILFWQDVGSRPSQIWALFVKSCNYRSAVLCVVAIYIFLFHAIILVVYPHHQFFLERPWDVMYAPWQVRSSSNSYVY